MKLILTSRNKLTHQFNRTLTELRITEESFLQQINISKIFQLYKIISKQGYSKTQYNIGNMYDNRERITINKKQSFKWYKKSVKQWHAKAQRKVQDMNRERP